MAHKITGNCIRLHEVAKDCMTLGQRKLYISKTFKDCDDVSDEKNCRTIAIDPEKYLKSKPPPSLQAGTKLPVMLR